MSEEHKRRFEDTWIGKVVRIWPVVIGLGGIAYSLITNYNITKSNTVSIGELNIATKDLGTRMLLVEKEVAVKNSQFAIILGRIDKLDDKLDRLSTYQSNERSRR